MLKKLLDIFLKLSPREKGVLIGTVFALSILFLDRLVAGPALHKLRVLDQQITQEENAIRKSLVTLLRKNQITVEQQTFSGFAVEAKNPEEEMTSLLKEIEGLAERSSVNLLYVKPGNTEEKGKTKKYSATLECEAQMPKLTVFFYQIESSKELLQIEKYMIQPKSGEREKGLTVARCLVTVSKTVLLKPQ
ncbi:MAG: hypothetical protein A3C47_05485 [Omnitrophica bacterium RIFCSPHIGHO2_02_FULL_51_18]|nr:MAG: hypothetical protein A3C47_05485 [Omnitrophica bacterium RIFCSPHIGHO2_02_FULL_51_18]